MIISLNHTARKICRIYQMVLLIVLTFSASTNVQAQTTPEFQLKAVFMYNFTRFVEWNPGSFESYNDPFIITIIGNDPFGSYLEETVRDEKIGRHPIVIRRVDDIRSVETCHILYINEKDPPRIRQILAGLQNRNILTVSDAPNFASLGGVIGFYTENNRIRMQINTAAARNAQLNISSKLLRVAKII